MTITRTKKFYWQVQIAAAIDDKAFYEMLNFEVNTVEQATVEVRKYLTEKSNTVEDVWWKTAVIKNVELIEPNGEFIVMTA